MKTGFDEVKAGIVESKLVLELEPDVCHGQILTTGDVIDGFCPWNVVYGK